MLFKKISKLNNILIGVLFFVAILGFTSNPQISFAEISAGSYCQLTIQSMQKEISNFQDLISLVKQYGSDPPGLSSRERVKKMQFDQAKSALFSSYGMTPDEYVLYAGRNKQEIDEYLTANLGVKQQIDGLSAQVTALMDQYEALKKNVRTVLHPYRGSLDTSLQYQGMAFFDESCSSSY